MPIAESKTELNERPERIRVGIAEYAVTAEDAVLATSGLGSCIGVGMVDDGGGVAGLAHIMLPSADDGVDGNPGKYADTGVEALIAEMEAAGASRVDTVAKIAGGSSMLPESTVNADVGRRNVEAVRKHLERVGVELVSEDVGGSNGRSIELDAATGAVRSRAAHGDVRIL